MAYVHSPIFVKEIKKYIIGEQCNYFLDCTLGEGGHSEAILNNYPDIKVFGIERDKEILEIAKNRLKKFGDRFYPVNCNFKDIDKKKLFDIEFDAILVDLGISMYHYKVSKRGFTFLNNENLNMKLDEQSISVYDIVNYYNENEIANILYEYGEERFSRNIAKNIINYRKQKKIETTFELNEIIEKSIPAKFYNDNIHKSTKSFMALRIFSNNELENIKIGIPILISLLKKGGKLGVITFHSIEDRIVKQIFNYFEKDCICPKEVVKCVCSKKKEIKILFKALKPDEQEIKDNPSSRSAKLRIIEKL